MKLQKNFNFIFNPLLLQITKGRWLEDDQRYFYPPSSDWAGLFD